MYPHRDPIRTIRADYATIEDRLAALHEHRVDEDHHIRGEENRPLLVYHMVPESIFDEASDRLPASEMLENDVELYKSRGTGSTHSKPYPGGIEVSVDWDDTRYDAGEVIRIYELGLLEHISARSTYEKNDTLRFPSSTVAKRLGNNLGVLMGLLFDQGIEEDVLAVATFVGFDTAIKRSDWERFECEFPIVPSPVVRFPIDGLDTESMTYNGHVSSLERMFEPLWHSERKFSWDLEVPDEIEVPDYESE